MFRYIYIFICTTYAPFSLSLSSSLLIFPSLCSWVDCTCKANGYSGRRYCLAYRARSSLPTTETYAARNRETVATERHPPQDTKIVAGPSSWLTAWLGLALVGWLEVRTVVERLVGLEIAWWWVFVEVSEAPPWYLAASNPSRWGCKQQPCPVVCLRRVSPLPCSPSADASFTASRRSFPTSVLSVPSGTLLLTRRGNDTRRPSREKGRESLSRILKRVLRRIRAEKEREKERYL